MVKKKLRSIRTIVKKASAKRSAPKQVVAKRSAPKRKAPGKKATTISIAAPKVRSRINPYSLAYSLGILNALCVLAMTGLGKGQEVLSSMLFSYSTSLQGLIVGMIEATIWGLVGGFVIGWLYNKFN